MTLRSPPLADAADVVEVGREVVHPVSGTLMRDDLAGQPPTLRGRHPEHLLSAQRDTVIRRREAHLSRLERERRQARLGAFLDVPAAGVAADVRGLLLPERG